MIWLPTYLKVEWLMPTSSDLGTISKRGEKV